ncbi:nitrile hydratase subunit alpha [Lentzea sp. BCCO 10_0798]|uniref:Nitrile hydratase subunit alpha n=1 Tax=Lentzea kristufekii TaxID=3095430 RepID=A0ABU4TKC6_9PSEU|nr:nitrile hydratase subunit alpha [Lentzea sp. BCCO 10_0798]MDX8048713.1 nitrile hydratase subunit alpha [Lentzea sp. BCCO 10_0798]
MSDDHDDSPIAARVRELEAILEEKGLLDPRELDQVLEAFTHRASPANGFRVVARAWTDDGFRARLLENANEALPELGLSMGGGLQVQRLHVVENTGDVHNVLVCTLCSCYPLSLLGPSPTWYKSPAYRARVVSHPREVLEQFGLTLPETTRIEVWDANAESRYMVLPRRPEGTGDLTEAELAALVTRNGLIGTAAV